MSRDLTGKQVGRLTVTDKASNSFDRKGCVVSRWNCLCECGNTCIVYEVRLMPESKTPPTNSCGCLQKESGYKKKSSHGRSYNPEYVMYTRAKRNATSRGREFNLSVDDLPIPDICPLLGIEIKKGKGKLCDASPSVDRKDNTKGYVKGNVWVISNQANRIKSNASIEELELLLKNLKENK